MQLRSYIYIWCVVELYGPCIGVGDRFNSWPEGYGKKRRGRRERATVGEGERVRGVFLV